MPVGIPNLSSNGTAISSAHEFTDRIANGCSDVCTDGGAYADAIRCTDRLSYSVTIGGSYG